jgi:protein SCO1
VIASSFRGLRPVVSICRGLVRLGRPRGLPLPARVLTLALLLLALAGCGGSRSLSSSGGGSRFEGTPANGFAAPGFALRDQHGQLVSLAAERGKYVVVTFLYVHCKDVCPIIAGQLNQALRMLGPARNDVRVLAVSVDPKGDTPSAVRHFIAVHRLLPQFLYLTGTVEQLMPVWHGYHIASSQTRKGIVVGHTAIEILLDPSGKPRLIYDSHVTGQEIVHDLHALGLGA